MRAVWCLAILLLSGCAAPAPEPLDATVVRFEGWVLDDIGRGLAGATVTAVQDGIETTTDTNGWFRLEGMRERDLHTIVASMDGFRTGSTVAGVDLGRRAEVQITLERIPDSTPYVDVVPFRGFISCGLLIQAEHSHGSGDPDEHDDIDCGGGNFTQGNQWMLPVDPDIARVVVEVFWDADTPLAEYLTLFIEGVNETTEETTIYSFSEGTTGLMGVVHEGFAQNDLADEGGLLSITIRPGVPEDDVVAGAFVNQEFDIIASMFYHDPGPRDYHFGGAV